jgi:hypothetical protein
MPSMNWDIKVIFDGKLDGVSLNERNKLEAKLGENGFLYVKNHEYSDLESTYEEESVSTFICDNNETLTKPWDRTRTDLTAFKKYLNDIGIRDKSEQGKWKSKLAKYIIEKSTKKSILETLPFLNKIFNT